MADADPRVEHYMAQAAIEAGKRFGAKASAHDVGVRKIFVKAWASCVNGRLEGVRARIPDQDFEVSDIAGERNALGLEAQVMGRFVRAWLDDPQAIDITWAGYASHNVRVHLGISAVILSVVDRLSISDADKRELKRACVRTKDPEVIIDGEVEDKDKAGKGRDCLYLQAYARPPQLRQALEHFGESDGDIKAYNENVDGLLMLAKTVFPGGLSRPLAGTENHLGDGVPKNALLREVAQADVDVFIERKYALLEDDPYVADDPDELPTPDMLGVFPHPPTSMKDWRVRAGTDALYQDSLEFLGEISDLLTERGFTTTAPVIDAAIAALRGRARQERTAPGEGEPEEDAGQATAAPTRDIGAVGDPDLLRRRTDEVLDTLADALVAAARAAIAEQLGREVVDHVVLPELSAYEREVVSWLARSAVDSVQDGEAVAGHPGADAIGDGWGEPVEWGEWTEPDDFEEED